MTPGAVLAVWEWSRPWGLSALALPILVLLAARLVPRAPRIASGAADLWESTAESDASAKSRHRPRVPLATWLLCAGLALGALVLAGPRAEVAHRRWRVIVDRSPSMYLESGGGTRLARALALAESWIEEHTADGDQIEWCEAFGARSECATGRSAPESWRAAPRIPRSEVDWSLFDEVGTLWITDRAPLEPVRHAGVIASGGPLVPGAVSASSESVFEWDGTDRLTEVPLHGERGRVCVIGESALPDALRGVLDAWALARGWTVVVGDAPDARLSIRTSAATATRSVRAGRDGWAAAGEIGAPAPAFDADGDLETWLSIAQGERDAEVIVRAAPGRIVSAWISMREPEGDPAAFAVSWATLFDSVVLPPREIVSVAERMDAGAELVRDARDPASGAPAGKAFDAWLAFAASACVLAAWGVKHARARAASRS